MVARALPLTAVLVFYGLGFGWRAWVQLRRYGSSGTMSPCWRHSWASRSSCLWISLTLLVGAGLGIRRHVPDEEAYLARTYGEEYIRYAARVGRFVPGVGRLRPSRR